MPGKEVILVPVKWSALKVSLAADEVEEHVSQIIEPLEKARVAVVKALNIPGIPQYIESRLTSIQSEIERVNGGIDWQGNPHGGSIRKAIERLRDDIPADDLKAEIIRASYGSPQPLI